jgi:hypothetical protein
VDTVGLFYPKIVRMDGASGKPWQRGKEKLGGEELK